MQCAHGTSATGEGPAGCTTTFKQANRKAEKPTQTPSDEQKQVGPVLRARIRSIDVSKLWGTRRATPHKLASDGAHQIGGTIHASLTSACCHGCTWAASCTRCHGLCSRCVAAVSGQVSGSKFHEMWQAPLTGESCIRCHCCAGCWARDGNRREDHPQVNSVTQPAEVQIRCSLWGGSAYGLALQRSGERSVGFTAL
jgi:hypothetical protein